MSFSPHFFVVGAQKAGTTSLHNWLVQQPDICLPRNKETQYFTYEDKYKKGLAWYLKQFPNCNEDACFGEVCPDYMFFYDALMRMKTVVKYPKIIIIFRHPIDRAFSHYQMTVRNGYEKHSFSSALLKEEYRIANKKYFALAHYSYIRRGMYVSQLNNLHAVFPKSKFLYIKFDELIDSSSLGNDIYKLICEFIGVKSSHNLADRSIKSNPASEPISSLLRNFLYGSSPIKGLLGKLISNEDQKNKIGLWLDKINNREKLYKTEFEVPQYVFSMALREIIKLKEYTGLNIDDWLHRKYNVIN